MVSTVVVEIEAGIFAADDFRLQEMVFFFPMVKHASCLSRFVFIRNSV